MNDVVYLDKHGVREIYPPSDSTIARQMAQDEDPFPAGAIIGGKRYWRKDEVLDWLARQFGDRDEDGAEKSPLSEPPATRSGSQVAKTPTAGAA